MHYFRICYNLAIIRTRKQPELLAVKINIMLLYGMSNTKVYIVRMFCVTGQVTENGWQLNFFIQCKYLWHVLDHCLVQVYLKYPASKERYRRSSCGGCSKSAGNVLPKFLLHFLNSLNYRKFNYFSSEIFSSTTDMWSSSIMEPYMSFSVHFINDEWILQSRCLQTLFVPIRPQC